MRKRITIVSTLLLAVIFLYAAALIAAEAASVKITKCEYDEMEGAITIEYNFVKGPKGDHVHLWVDGKEKKPTKMQKGLKLIDIKLSKGEHKVELRANDSSHTEIGINDTYKLVVK